LQIDGLIDRGVGVVGQVKGAIEGHETRRARRFAS
jgi:hypothetical protein